MKRPLCSLVVLGLASFALLGCESGEKTTTQASASMGAMNDKCPISGGAVDPNAKTVSYMGSTVGFCCNACAGPWDRKSDEEKAASLAMMKKK